MLWAMQAVMSSWTANMLPRSRSYWRVQISVREHVLSVLGESLQDRGVLGKLYEPAPHAEALLELSPSASHVVLSIEQCWLDAKAFTACKTHQYLCTRRPSSQPPYCAPSKRALHVGDIP